MDVPAEPNRPGPDAEDQKDSRRLLLPHSLVMREMRDPFVIIDSEGFIIDMNPATKTILGWSRDEMMGVHVNGFYGMAKISDLAQGEIGDNVEKNGYWQGEYSLVRRDGITVRAEATSYPFSDDETGKTGRVTIIRDITERKEAEQALKIFQAAIDSSLDAICLGDPDGTLTYVNDSFVQMWGFENADEVLGSSAMELWADREHAAQDLGELWEKGTWKGENLGRRADGREIDVRLAANIIRDEESGEPLAWMASLQDITREKMAERALQLTQHAVDTSVLSTALVDVEGRFTYVNDAFLKLWGYDDAGEVLGKSSLEQFEDQEWAGGALQDLAATGIWSGERRGKRQDGSEIHVELRGSTVRDEDSGELIAFLVTGEDITERRKVQVALKVTQDAIDSSLNALCFSDLDGNLTYVNDSFVRMWGYDHESELIGKPAFDFWVDPERAAEDMGDLLEQGTWTGEQRGRRRDGREIDVLLAANVVRDGETGDPVAWMTSSQDVTVRNRLIREMQSSETQFRAAMAGSLDAIFYLDAVRDENGGVVDFEYTAVNERGLAMLDAPHEKVIGGRVCELFPQTRPNGLFDKLLGVLEAGAPFEEEYENFAERVNPEWIHHQVIPVGDTLVIHSRDIGGRKEAEETVRRQSTVMQEMRDAVLITEENGIAIDCNPAMEEVVGFSRDEIIGRETYALWDAAEAPPKLRMSHRKAVAEGRDWYGEFKFKTMDGRFIHAEMTTLPIGDRTDDKGHGRISIIRDITDRKEAQEQLQQAQKMEAVGQLTGGIAHDFNNLLAVISGNLELAQERLPADSDTRKMLSAGIRASERGAALTRQLLAFSRRQMLMPQPTDVNELTEHMLGLARRTLGEAVEVVFEPVEEAWWANVDPAQLENALLNLAINARDAMPGGGTLTIRTENVGARGKTLGASDDLLIGEYVLIEVVDTGAGMSEEVREKVFEPFFTTKEVGEGSGLGLSMVYGFAKQSGGHVDIESTLGEGTTIRLYLPRTEPASQDVSNVRPAEFEVGSSGETVLIVEDDPHVRELAVSLVVSLGYTVLQAGEATSALEIMENGTQIDLLLSDVILGQGMNGVELANQVRESYPKTKVLLMSGDAREAFTQEDGLGDTYELISKPFRLADLAQHIEVLLQ